MKNVSRRKHDKEEASYAQKLAKEERRESNIASD
jgi:hypothetical protein